MSKKAEVYKKELEIKDPLVEKIGGKDYFSMLKIKRITNTYLMTVS